MALSPPVGSALGVALALLETDADAARVTAAYEAALDEHPDRRRQGGVYYTPAAAVEHVLDLTLEPVLARTPPADLPGLRVGDPTCGAGHFLLGAWARLRAHLTRAGFPHARALAAACLYGTDVDADALVLADHLIRRVSGGASATLRRADSLIEDGPRLDVIVGNPPFLNQLGTRTTTSRAHVAALRARFPGAVHPYTDPAWLHLLAAHRELRPGGRIGLLQPRSFLVARDAAAVRGQLAAVARVRALWDGGLVFPGVAVQVVAVVLEAGPPDGRPVAISVGLPPGPAPPAHPPSGPSWAPLLPAPGDLPRVPPAALRVAGASVLGDHATSAADFRDEYYGLIPHVVDREHADEVAFPRLITTGLVDPGASAWGRRSTRFARQPWTFPRVCRAGLDESPRLGAWARRRLRPKVLVATQTRALEAVVDVEGGWLTVTPLLSLYPHAPERLWHVAAVLMSPVATSWAHEHYGGAALSRDTLKLSAAQLLTVPAPPPGPDWDAAAARVRAAHVEPTRREAHLRAAGEHMLAAWGLTDPALLEGWARRLATRPPRAG